MQGLLFGEQVEEGRGGRGPQLRVGRSIAVSGALGHEPEEVLHGLGADHVPAETEDSRHGLHEPLVVGREPLGHLADAPNHVLPDGVVPGLLQKGNHLVHHDFHVVPCGHLLQQLEGLLPQGRVGVFQAVDHGHLVLLRVLAVHANDVPEGVDGGVPEVVVWLPQEVRHDVGRGR